MDGLRSIAPLSKESLRGVAPSKVGKAPRFEWVDPKTIFVEDSYQRRMTESGTALVRRIVGGFDWSKFKPPVCVELQEWDNVLVCIDGQHTATGAASHPDVKLIPVMIVDAGTVAGRAQAFVGHNRDRIALTAMAMFHAEVASGEETACEVAAACEEAGAAILPGAVNLRLRQAVGATIAVGAMKGVVKRRGKPALVQVLKVLIAAERGPIKAGEITATDIILSAMPAVADRLAKVVASKTAEAWAALAMMESSSDVRRKHPDALATLWLRAMNMPIQQRAPAAPAKAEPELKAARPPRAAAEKPKPAVRLPPAPAPAPPAPPAEVVLSAGPNAASVLEHGGVSIDLRTREVSHRGGKAVLSDDGVRLVAALARVKPSLLDDSILIRKSFAGGAASKEALKDLINATNRALAATRLEVKTFAVGRMLADLDG